MAIKLRRCCGGLLPRLLAPSNRVRTIYPAAEEVVLKGKALFFLLFFSCCVAVSSM